MNTIVISIINHSYWSYVHQPSYRRGAPHCTNQESCQLPMAHLHVDVTDLRDLRMEALLARQLEHVPWFIPLLVIIG